MNPQKEKIKVLIVDNDPEFTDLLNAALEFHKDYQVRVQNNPGLAVDTAKKFIPDIVILDVVMPEIDGGEVHSRFKADSLLKDIPIIFLSSIVHQNEIDQHNGMIGGLHYLAKPVSAKVLVNAIAERLRR
jgi:DNA-binding response OmpR family regulator